MTWGSNEGGFSPLRCYPDVFNFSLFPITEDSKQVKKQEANLSNQSSEIRNGALTHDVLVRS